MNHFLSAPHTAPTSRLSRLLRILALFTLLPASTFLLTGCFDVVKGTYAPVAAAVDPVTGKAVGGGPASTSNTAVMKINFGGEKKTVIIQLKPEMAPKTVANFRKLVNDGYYNGMAWHRVIPKYLVQTGDPLSKDDANSDDWGTGDPGYRIPSEIGGTHVKGSVAMARLNDDINPSRASNGSQFYISLRDLRELDGKYTVFGQITHGLDVLEEISKVVADTNDKPVQRIEVTSIGMIRDADAAPLAADDRERNKRLRPRSTKEESEKDATEKLIERIW